MKSNNDNNNAHTPLIKIIKMAAAKMSFKYATLISRCIGHSGLINHTVSCTILCRKYHDLSKAGIIQSATDSASVEFKVGLLKIVLVFTFFELKLTHCVS